MAERKFLFMASDGFSEEGATTDSLTLGGLTMGGNIDMNSAGKIVNANAATASGDVLVYGQANAEVANLSITSGGDIVLSGGGELTGLPSSPSGNTAAASKAYVDSVAQGLDVHDSVRAATTTAGTLASDFENADVIDGVTLATGDRILIKDQSSGIENGIYVVQATGAPVRADDWATGYEAAGAFVFVEEGTANADNGFVCTNDGATDTTGTHALVFSQFSGAGQITAGDGLVKSGNTLDVDLATNPGLQFTSAKLDLLLKSANELAKDASGLYVVGVPSLFKINGTAVGATVTAANLDDLTDTSSADSLHTHTGSSVSLNHSDLGSVSANQHHNQVHAIDGADHTASGLTAGHVLTATGATTFAFQALTSITEASRLESDLVAVENVAKGDPVYHSSTADKFGKADAGTNSKAYVFGIAKAAINADATGEIVSYGLAAGVLTGATPGAKYYLADGGGLSTSTPGGGKRVILIGWAQNATDLWVQPIDYGKKAA